MSNKEESEENGESLGRDQEKESEKVNVRE